MKNRPQKRILTLLIAVMLCMAAFPLTAYAGGGEEIPQEVTPPPEPVAAPNPFTPAGTGTVVDNATDEDGKEFYTIMTPDENVFYLIIDKQRGTENVYFLNAVTEKDLLSLAAKTGEPAEPQPPATIEPTPEPTPEPAPEPEKGSGNGMMIFLVIALLAGGGAAYYFKIYRPKQEQADNTEDDYSEYDDDPYAEQEDDSAAWYEDEDEAGADSEDGDE